MKQLAITLFICATSAAIAADKPCVRVALLGEFKRATARTAQPYGQEIERGARIGYEYVLSKEEPLLCADFSTVDINNSVSNVGDSVVREYRERQISLFLGLGSSDQAIAAQEALKKTGTLLLTPTASSERLNVPGSRTIMLFPSNGRLAERIAEDTFATKAQKAKLAIFFGANSEYSRDIADRFETAARARGVQSIQKTALRLGGIKKSDLASTPKDTTHVFLPLYELDTARALTHLMEVIPNAQVLGTDSWGTVQRVLRRLLGPTRVHARIPSVYATEFETSENKMFFTSYRGSYGIDPTDLSAFSFDGILLLQKLLKTCGQKRLLETPESCLGSIFPIPLTTGIVRKSNRLAVDRPIPMKDFVHEGT